jgi:3-oxoacyl-[acyl-carrier protein] reductase
VARMPDAMPGGLLIACIAIEALTRQLAVELGPKGVRAVCLRPDGMTETARMGSVTEPVWRRAIERTGGSFEEYLDAPDPFRVLPDPVRLADVAATALFMASDGAAAITGTVVNIAAGKFLDQA